jgi:hypothetical protein
MTAAYAALIGSAINIQSRDRKGADKRPLPYGREFVR